MQSGRNKTIILSLSFIIVSAIGLGVKKMTESTQHEQRMAFLKENDSEITKHIEELGIRIREIFAC